MRKHAYTQVVDEVGGLRRFCLGLVLRHGAASAVIRSAPRESMRLAPHSAVVRVTEDYSRFTEVVGLGSEWCLVLRIKRGIR